MKILGLILGLLCLLALASPALAGTNDIRGYCARVFDGYTLRLRCEQSEAAAYRRLSNSRVPQEVSDYCNRIFESWSLTERCIQSELRARDQLGGGSAPGGKDCRRFFCD